MRVALCLSGQPRLYKECYEWIKAFIIDEYGGDNVDVFCHFWWDGETGFPALSVWNEHMHDSDSFKNIDEDIEKNMIKIYNPKGIQYHKQNNLVERFYNGDKTQLRNDRDNVYKIWQDTQVSLWKNYPKAYQKYMRANLKQIFESQGYCQQLKLNYEKENNFKYDLVIRTRYDLAFHPHYNLEKDEVNPPFRGSVWDGKFGNFPSLEEIKQIFNNEELILEYEGEKHRATGVPNIITEWDNLWMYPSENHDVLMDKMCNQFEYYFKQIVGEEKMTTASGREYDYSNVDILAIPEHLQETVCRDTETRGTDWLGGCGLSALLWIPRDIKSLNDSKENWKKAIKAGHKGEIW